MNELNQNVLIAKRIELRSGSPSQLKKGVELETFVLICLSMRGSRSIMIPSRPSQHRVIHPISPQTALLCQTNDQAPCLDITPPPTTTTSPTDCWRDVPPLTSTSGQEGSPPLNIPPIQQLPRLLYPGTANASYWLLYDGAGEPNKTKRRRVVQSCISLICASKD